MPFHANHIADPKIEAALAEIVAVMRKHDMGGNIVLASRTHAGFRTVFPEWCTIKPLESGRGVHIKLSSNDREGSDASLHCVLSMTDLTTLVAVQLQRVGGIVLEKLKAVGVVVDHQPFGGGGIVEPPDVR